MKHNIVHKNCIVQETSSAKKGETSSQRESLTHCSNACRTVRCTTFVSLSPRDKTSKICKSFTTNKNGINENSFRALLVRQRHETHHITPHYTKRNITHSDIIQYSSSALHCTALCNSPDRPSQNDAGQHAAAHVALLQRESEKVRYHPHVPAGVGVVVGILVVAVSDGDVGGEHHRCRRLC